MKDVSINVDVIRDELYAILHQPRTLPLARYVILSWVEPFPYASRKGSLTRLVDTHLQHGPERYAFIA